MDRVITETQVFKCWGFSASQASYTPPYPNAIATGAGVYIGIVDTGIDSTNIDFRPVAGGNRIEWIWDQTSTVGPPPAEFTYGQEWNNSQIVNGVVTSGKDTDGRGTALAGICAASGRNTGGTWTAYRYVGMAPEATLVICKNWSQAPLYDVWKGLYDPLKVKNAIRYCFLKANYVGAPCVVVVPQWDFLGGHDGTAVWDQEISAIVDEFGAGHVVVAPVSNCGSYTVHANFTIGSVGAQASCTLLIPTFMRADNVSEYVEGEAWHSLTGSSFSAKLTSPNGISTGWVVPGTSFQVLNSTDGSFEIRNALTTQTTTKGKRIYWRMYDLGTSEIPPAAGTWLFEFERLSSTTDGELDLWMENFLLPGVFKPPTITSANATSLSQVATPATGESIIGIGAYTNKTTWYSPNGSYNIYAPAGINTTHSIANFSARGPRRDDEYRPDINAPGFGVNASRSSFDINHNSDCEDGVHKAGRDTTRAAAVVAGATALFLQINPTATAEQVRQWLRSNAAQDSYTGTVPNGPWGYGKLRAFPLTGESPPLAMSYALISASLQKFRFTALAGATFKASTLNDTNITAADQSGPIEITVTSYTTTTFDTLTQALGPTPVVVNVVGVTDEGGRLFAATHLNYDVNAANVVTSWY